MRGIMGVGTNRINEYTIKWATMGLAHFVVSPTAAHLKSSSPTIPVAIPNDLPAWPPNPRFYGIVAYVFKNPSQPRNCPMPSVTSKPKRHRHHGQPQSPDL
jgi:hypothetical protein